MICEYELLNNFAQFTYASVLLEIVVVLVVFCIASGASYKSRFGDHGVLRDFPNCAVFRLKYKIFLYLH